MTSSAFNFQKIFTKDTMLDRIQSNIEASIAKIGGPFIGGNLLTQQAIATTDTVINHGLGRVPQLWVIADQDTNTSVFRTSWNENSITLQAGAACTISLWVN